MRLKTIFLVLTTIVVSVAITLIVQIRMKSNDGKIGTILYWAKDQTDQNSVMLVLSWPNDFTKVENFYAYLMNHDGSIHHQWQFDRNPMHARLLPNGNLLVIFMARDPDRKSNIRGECDEIAEFNWAGEKVWSISLPMLHHDLFPIDDDHIASLQSEPLPVDAKARFFPNVPGVAMGDSIVVIQKSTKETVWRWSFTDALIDLQDRIIEPEYFNVAHINSVQFLKSNPWTEKPAYVISIRQLSTILVIEEETKRILWTSPRGMVHFQHDAQLLEDGKILVFDNGIRKSAVDSRVLLIDPKSNQIAWQWTDDQRMWASQLMGGVQRQPNGNYLVTNSMIGQLFEINPDGEFVWNFIGKFDTALDPSQQRWWPGMKMYRVHSYPRPNM